MPGTERRAKRARADELTRRIFSGLMARAGGREGNKGWEAALAVLEMAAVGGQLVEHGEDAE